jgi:hypothetical protein
MGSLMVLWLGVKSGLLPLERLRQALQQAHAILVGQTQIENHHITMHGR